MYGLVAILTRYSGIITFVILESVCMYLVVKYNRNQNEIYLNSSKTISGAVYQRYNKVMQFAALSVIADSMAEENARLYARLGNAKFNEYLVKDSTLVRDSLNHIRQQYIYISALVINNSISLANNYITINRGRKHGVLPGMGVFSAKGVVGVVKNVSENFAQVISVLHQQSRISASLKNSNYFGTLRWKDQSDITHITLETIPKHAVIQAGDTVQTSGYSYIFPVGLPIGTVENYQVETGSNYFSADVKLFEDLGRLKYVYVINNLMRYEQDKLSKLESVQPK
ncbi:MAG: rod shape-determining protein MreC [Saprospiraceae bacterium]